MLNEIEHLHEILRLSNAVTATADRLHRLEPTAPASQREQLLDELVDQLIPLLKTQEGTPWLPLIKSLKHKLSPAQRDRLNAEFPDWTLN